MHHRQTVHQYRHVITGLVLAFRRGVLMNHLQAVLEDMSLVYQFDVLETGIVLTDELKLCRAVILQQFGLVLNRCARIGYLCAEETLPLVIGKLNMIEPL